MMISKKNCLGQQFAKILCETTICQKRLSGIVIYKVCKKKSNSEQHLQKQGKLQQFGTISSGTTICLEKQLAKFTKNIQN